MEFADIANSICPGFSFAPELNSAYNDIFRWCIEDASGPLDPDKGLWLYGSIGCGKSTLAAVIREFTCHHRAMLGDDGKVAAMWFSIFNAVQICSEYARKGYEGIQPYIDCPRLVIDEIGSETIPTGHYGTVENVMQYILQRRYDRRLCNMTIVTTNIGRQQIADIYGKRIYDRCSELFNFVRMVAPSFRRGTDEKDRP